MATIDIRSVSKAFGATRVIGDLSLSVEAGEFVVILGPSGCGKSTLLRMIAGLEDVGTGEIAIDGVVVDHLEPGDRGCAMVFQNYALYPHMSVADNIGYSLKVSGTAKGERLARVREIARMLDIEPLLARRPAELSGGQRQRVAMGRAMIRSPKVFLYDEPLSNLDAKLRLQMRLEIKRLHRELRTTSLFVTHDQTEAMTLADRIVVMNAGHIEQTGTPREVYQRPASLFVARFLGAPPMNLFDGVVAENGRIAIEGWADPLPGLRWPARAGDRVTLGVRPNAFDVTPVPTTTSMRFVAEMREDLGSETHLHGALSGTGATLVRPADELVPADDIHLSIPASAAHVFAADGGRLEPICAATSLAQSGQMQWTA